MFGSYRLGYAWALLEPLLMISAFSLIFGMRSQSGFGGVPARWFYHGRLPAFHVFQQCSESA